MKITQIIEFIPLVIFFISYKFLGLKTATIILISSTILFNVVSYLFNKKINYVSIFSSLLLILFGGLTIYFDDMKFIKMKPSIINSLFALILFVGLLYKRGLIKHIMSGAIRMSEENWLIFSRRWCLFFLGSAMLNEIVWRNFSESFWVKYKVFGSSFFLLLFIAFNLPFLTKNSNIGDNVKNS